MKFQLLFLVLFVTGVLLYTPNPEEEDYGEVFPGGPKFGEKVVVNDADIFKTEEEILKEIDIFVKPAVNLITRLDEMIEENKATLAENVLIHEENMADCDADKAHRDEQIAEAETAKLNAQAHKTSCQTAQNNAELHIANLEAEIIVLEDYKQAKITQRDIENKKFLADKAQVEATLSGIDECLEILKEFKNYPASLVEMNNKMNKLAKNFIQLKNYEALNNLVLLQASILDQPEEVGTLSLASIQKIEAAILKLQGDIQAYLDSLIDTENKLQGIFDALMIKIAELDQAKDDEIASEGVYVDQAVSCVLKEQAIIDEAQNKFDRNSEIQENTIKLCEDHDEEFKKEKADREKYIVMLQKLKRIIVRAEGNFSFHLYPEEKPNP